MFGLSRKIPKTLSGIETEENPELSIEAIAQGRKIPKTLSGIETMHEDIFHFIISAGKYLKPYQGLKLSLVMNKLHS